MASAKSRNPLQRVFHGIDMNFYGVIVIFYGRQGRIVLQGKKNFAKGFLQSFVQFRYLLDRLQRLHFCA